MTRNAVQGEHERFLRGDVWIVQDVFSGGLAAPGFTVHETREAAQREAELRPSASVPFQPVVCPTCLSLLGLDGQPLQGGCNECR